MDRSVLSVTFDETLDTDSAPASSAFTVTARPAGGTSRTIKGTSAAVTISGATATVTLASAVAADETVTVSYAKPASSPLQDPSGNDVETFTGRQAANDTDETGPVFKSAAVNGRTVTLVFDEALDESVTIGGAASPFFQQIAGESATNATGATVKGRTVTLTFPAITGQARHGQRVNVWYSAPPAAARQFRDLSGNRLATTNAGDWTVTNNTPPAFSSAAVSGKTLTITFDGALDESSVPAPGDFHVTVGTGRRDVAEGGVAIAGAQVRLTLASAVLDTDTVKVRYTPGANKLKDADNARLPVATFPDQAVTNNTPADGDAPRFESATVNGATLTMTFSEDLDETKIPYTDTFVASVDGVEWAHAWLSGTNLVVAGRTVTGTLRSAGVTHGQTVRVNYTHFAVQGHDRVRDRAGNAAPNFGYQPVTNNTPADETGPAFESAAVNGATLTVTFSEDLDETKIPYPDTFAASVDGVEWAHAWLSGTNLVVAGRTVTGTLRSAGVTRGQTVRVNYTHFAVQGYDRVRDRAGNAAPNFGYQPVTNNTPPAFASAAVYGKTLTVTFDGALDPNSVPAPGDFHVTVGTGRRDVAEGGVAIADAQVRLTLASAVLDTDTVKVRYTPGANKLKDADNARLPVTGFPDQAVTNNTRPLVVSAPTIDLVRIVSWPTHDADGDGTDDTYIRGDRILVDVEFSEEVMVTGAGDVRLRLDVGANDADQANSRKIVALHGVYIGGRTLRFAYEVQPGDTDADGVWVQVEASSNRVVFEPDAAQRVVSAITGQPADLTTNHLIEDLPATSNPRHKVDGSVTGVAGPTVESARVRGDRLTVTFDKNLAALADRDKLRHALAVHGAGTIHGGDPNDSQSPVGVSVSGKTLTLTLGAGARAGETVMLSYHGEELRGAGAKAPRFRDLAVENQTPGAARPSPLSATVSQTTLRVVFDGPLDGASAPAGRAFRVEASRLDDSSYDIRGTGTAAVSGSMVEVELARAPEENELVTVSYTKPAANPLQGAGSARPPVLSFDRFTVGTVVLVDLVPPTFEGGEFVEAQPTRAVLRFSEALDESSVPAAGDFEVEADGDPATVTDVAVKGSSVVLTVMEEANVEFLVTYTPGTNPIRDRAGNNAAGFSKALRTVVYPGAPVLRSAAVDGVRVTLTYDRSLDPASVPAPGAFSFHLPDHPTDGRQAYGRSVAAVAVELRTLVLTLDHPVQPCAGVYFSGSVPRTVQQPFTVTYAKPATDPIQDLGATPAGPLAAHPVTNVRAGDCRARVVAAREGSVIPTAERPLARDAEPQAAWFTVTASDELLSEVVYELN